jgi:hypothetical protein
MATLREKPQIEIVSVNRPFKMSLESKGAHTSPRFYFVYLDISSTWKVDNLLSRHLDNLLTHVFLTNGNEIFFRATIENDFSSKRYIIIKINKW